MKARTIAAGLLIAWFGVACAAPQAQRLKDVLPGTWTQERLLKGVEPAVFEVSPKECAVLYEALGGASRSEDGQGFANASGTYLLARDVKDEGLDEVMDRAGRTCSTMRMRYDSAHIVYAVEREVGKGVVLRLTAVDDGGQQIAHMLIGVRSGSGSTRLVRVLNTEHSLTEADSAALRLALNPEIAL
ncbi:hypothetical protein GT204_13555 [Streptomyces sp. SID4919]|uniref:hypothetical protein n=1 Tax=unclassified Streptomyces TaxID=2593676 RepID=UPI000823B48E|nr:MULTISPECIES: hypothetical protein [unclassified Streptomyces]MYY09912.1 hypothetical protein [Streptomyces sp. SID4919]SCK58359.1 hypothetical protein YW7DRAFT_05541 [Streptomyces sp. AmelKG-E11A]